MSNADYAVRCQVCDDPVQDMNGEEIKSYFYMDEHGMNPICIDCILEQSEMEA